MKKKIIVCVFLLLILVTAIYTVVVAIDSYLYDIDPANGVDLLEGWGAAFAMIIGGFVVLYETDLFYTVYYFFVKPKTATKSILNILSNLSLLLVFFSDYYSDIFKEDGIALILMFLTYVILRIVYFVISLRSWILE